MIRFAALLLVSSPILFATAAQTPGSPERSAAAGAYTEGQAVMGEKVFQANCASCHTTQDHTDEKFRFNWFGRTVYELWKTLKTTMPDDNVGGLSDDDYTRVTAYILKLNGFPPSTGTDSLVADSTELRKIRIGTADSTKTKPPQFLHLR